eukprot:jgi/Mesvir1/6221/Mv00901-RA.1
MALCTPVLNAFSLRSAAACAKTGGANLARSVRGGVVPLPLRPTERRTVAFCKLGESHEETHEEMNLLDKIRQPLAVALAAAVLLAGSPDEALAAQSGGRVGGRAFSGGSRTQSRGPPPPAATSSAAPPVVNNYYAAPPVVSPFGFSPFGFSPFGFSPFGFAPVISVGVPGGGLFSFFIFMITVSFVISAVGSFLAKKQEEKDRWE